MRITRGMYYGASDVYTDMLDIVTRSLGVNPVRVSLGEAISKRMRDGAGYSETVYDYRTYLEQFLHRELSRREAEDA